MSKIEESKLIALKLSSLSDSDLNWVLSKLDQETSVKLIPLIKEIKDLGIYVDKEVIESLFAKNSLAKIDHSVGSKPSSKNIASATFRSIQNLFKDEHESILVTIVSLTQSNWKNEVACKDYMSLTSVKGIDKIEDKPLLAKSLIVVTENLLSKNKAANYDSGPILRRAPIVESKSYKDKLLGVVRAIYSWRM